MNATRRLPQIIQGGMGIAVSNWRLARAAARAGALGVVSGTAIDSVLVRRLQDGDPDGVVRATMERFPFPDISANVLRQFFLPEGRREGAPYKLLPLYRQKVSTWRDQVTMLAAYVEVSLAREGHEGTVGINLLTKVQMPTLATLFGAMLAGVDVVLMGAGIPREIPGALDALSRMETSTLKLDVEGGNSSEVAQLTLNPIELTGGARPGLTRPLFFPIVSAATLAINLERKSNGRVDGFVVEGPTAGGHNAPPRGAMRLTSDGEPIYGDRDVVDLAAMREIGLPFWLAGGAGTPEGLARARSEGAAGIQVGTLFAYSEESGFTPDIKSSVLGAVVEGKIRVRTDVRASPTGYPFKLVEAGDALPRDEARERICDLGYLRVAVRGGDGGLNYRCPAEPVQLYISKGGSETETVDRKCLCNALMSCIGLPQSREGGMMEPPLVTSGDDLVQLGAFLQGRTHYAAVDVVDYLTSPVTANVTSPEDPRGTSELAP
ncbi:MAG: nitronate monooxygenase [Gemmatimonadaceae bacterium]